MKKLTYVFSAGIAGIVVCLVMTVVTAVKENHARNQPQPVTIPAPALSQ